MELDGSDRDDIVFKTNPRRPSTPGVSCPLKRRRTAEDIADLFGDAFSKIGNMANAIYTNNAPDLASVVCEEVNKALDTKFEELKKLSNKN